VEILARIIDRGDKAVKAVVCIRNGPGLRRGTAAGQGNLRLNAAWDGAVIRSGTPVLRAILVRSKTVFSLREGHDCLPLSIRDGAVVGVSGAVECINVQSDLRRAAPSLSRCTILCRA